MTELSLTRKVVARYKKAMEFKTPQELKKYLAEHPKADPHKHRVAPTTESGARNRSEYKPNKDLAKSVEGLGPEVEGHPFIKKLKTRLEGGQPIPKHTIDHAMVVLKSRLEDERVSKDEKAKIKQFSTKLKEHMTK